MDEPIVITRDLELEVPTDELWQLVGDGGRWHEWLTDSADVVVAPSQSGTVIDDDGVERRVAIHSVVPGERVRFEWWPSDRPDESSMVEIVIAPTPSTDGIGSRLSITETYAKATASVATRDSWDLRLMLLVLCIQAVALART